MRPSSFILAILLFVPVARAEDSNMVPAAVPPAKDPAMAYTLAFGATVLPLVASFLIFDSDGPVGTWMNVGALWVGPSAGQFYAGSPVTGLLGTGLRVGGSFLVASSISDMIGDNADASSFLAGLTIFTAGTLYSLVDTHFAVKRANQRARKAALPKTSLAPMLYPTRGGRLAPGMAACLTF
jgi:hypothetical protein